jgi:hypothetical protein
MKKYILIFVVALFGTSVNGQKSDRKIKLIASKNDCIIKLSFSNRGSSPTNIPDFSLRSDTAGGYMILRDDVVKESTDTLIIVLSSIKSADEANRVEISHHQGSGQEVVVKYKDIYLRKRNTQTIRLSKRFCLSTYRVLALWYDGNLLARCNLN